MFSDVNVDNRLRHLIRGRVIVFTTSGVVEFLDEKLSHSWPLYSIDVIPDGFGLCFCVELNGFLTFDPGSEVRITPELNEYTTAYYDPKAFALVRTADPSIITFASAGERTTNDFNEPVVTRVFVNHTTPQGSATTYLKLATPLPYTPGNDASFQEPISQIFPVGSLFKGLTGYPGYVFDPTYTAPY